MCLFVIKFYAITVWQRPYIAFGGCVSIFGTCAKRTWLEKCNWEQRNQTV